MPEDPNNPNAPLTTMEAIAAQLGKAVNASSFDQCDEMWKAYTAARGFPDAEDLTVSTLKQVGVMDPSSRMEFYERFLQEDFRPRSKFLQTHLNEFRNKAAKAYLQKDVEREYPGHPLRVLLPIYQNSTIDKSLRSEAMRAALSIPAAWPAMERASCNHHLACVCSGDPEFEATSRQQWKSSIEAQYPDLKKRAEGLLAAAVNSEGVESFNGYVRAELREGIKAGSPDAASRTMMIERFLGYAKKAPLLEKDLKEQKSAALVEWADSRTASGPASIEKSLMRDGPEVLTPKVLDAWSASNVRVLGQKGALEFYESFLSSPKGDLAQAKTPQQMAAAEVLRAKALENWSALGKEVYPAPFERSEYLSDAASKPGLRKASCEGILEASRELPIGEIRVGLLNRAAFLGESDKSCVSIVERARDEAVDVQRQNRPMARLARGIANLKNRALALFLGKGDAGLRLAKVEIPRPGLDRDIE